MQTNPNPKFDNYIRSQNAQFDAERSRSRPGIITSFNRIDNTATVILTGPNSDQIGDTYRDVPCPVYPGIQMAAPEAGRPCWVDFRGKDESRPIIVSYFNHEFSRFDYSRLYAAETGVPQYKYHV